MNTGNRLKLDTMSEADLEPVLELLQGGDPDVIACKAGIAKERLFRIRDDLLAQVEHERTNAADGPSKKIGRNAPCPCGSGKKYKHCCLVRDEAAWCAQPGVNTEDRRTSTAEQAQLIKRIEGAFDLLSSGRYAEARNQASRLIKRYPNEDRLHDILATAHLYAGEHEAAIDICRQRLAVAELEKSYFIEHGHYRDAEIHQPAVAYIYPPLTWVQKYWIALKAGDYQALYPASENAAISGLVRKLKTADDVNRFPAKHTQGLELRRNGLKETLEKLKTIGPEAIPYLLPLAVKYSWTGLLVPEILAVYPTDSAIRALIDISMFGFAYASGASLHYLEKRGEAVIAHIREAFSRDKEFDPIKTGIVSVLGNIRAPAAYETLLGLLEHESPHIVNWAGDALGKYNDVEALPAMVAASERIGGEPMIEAAILRLKDLENADWCFDSQIRERIDR
jgi:tetratricopeptide (TPR) repeat protein